MFNPIVFAITHSNAARDSINNAVRNMLQKPVKAAYNKAMTDIPPVIADMLKEEIVKQMDAEGYEGTVTINFTIKHK